MHFAGSRVNYDIKVSDTNQNKLNGPAIQVDYRPKYKAEFRTIVVYLQKHL